MLFGKIFNQLNVFQVQFYPRASPPGPHQICLKAQKCLNAVEATSEIIKYNFGKTVDKLKLSQSQHATNTPIMCFVL